MHETVYAIIATPLTIIMVYLSYLAFSNSGLTVWTPVAMKETPILQHDPHADPHREIQGGMAPEHFEKNEEGTWKAVAALAITSMAWSIFWYYFVNLLDWCVCEIFDLELCIRVWPWQYRFSTQYYNDHNSTAYDINQNNINNNHRGRWIWFSPTSELNIGVCYQRLWGMIIVTWMSACMMFYYWRFQQKMLAKQTTHQENVIHEEHGLMGGIPTMGAADGNNGGIFTKMVEFISGPGASTRR